jgi:hypothetical protein
VAKGNESKISGRHTSVIDEALPLVEAARKISSVRQIRPGFIKRASRGAQGRFRVKFIDQNGAVLMKVRGNLFVQEIWIYAESIQVVRESLTAFAIGQRMIVNI